MFNIAVVIPIQGRIELAKRVMLYYETLDVEGINIYTVPIIDPDDDLGTTETISFSPEGIPLGEKFNQGIAYASLFEPDGVMIVGSDDLVAPRVFENIVQKKPRYQEIKGVHFFNSKTLEMVFARKSHCGAGKYFSKDFLVECDYAPYDDKAERNVDNGPSRWVTGAREVVESELYSPCCIDIKTATNMTPWEVVERYNATENANADTVFAKIGEKLLHWVHL